MKLAYWILCGFILAGGVAGAWAASEPIGMVVGSEGNPQAMAPAGPARHLAVKSAVFAHDVITTGAGARLQIMLNDDSLLSLGENSELVLDEYTYDPARRDNNSLGMRIVRGITRVVTGRITEINPDRFKVKTSRATIGIRGCELGFDVRPDYDQIMIIRVPARHRIIVHNDVPGRPAAFAELTVTRPRWIKITEDGRALEGPLDPPLLRHLSTETTPAVASLPSSSPHGGAPEQEPTPPATPPSQPAAAPLSSADELAQDVLPAAGETQDSWLDNPPQSPPPPASGSSPSAPVRSFFRGGGLGADYKLGTLQSLSQLSLLTAVSGFISGDLTSVDFTRTVMDANGAIIDTQLLSLRDLPLANFGGTSLYEGYREVPITPGVLLANDNLHQFVRRIDLNTPSDRLTFWGYETAFYGASLPASQVLNYNIAEVLYPDSRTPLTGSEVNSLVLRVNTRTGTYAEYNGSTPLVFGRIEDLTFFGQEAQGVGFAGQNAAAQHAPAPDGVAFAGFRTATTGQPVESGYRDYSGYAAGAATPSSPANPARSLMSANILGDTAADNEQRVRLTLDKDAYQNNVNTAITLGQSPATASLSDLHLGTPQSSGYVQGDDFVARYRSASSAIELRTHAGGTDWVWGEWNGESVNAANGDRETVNGTFAAGRTLSPTEFMGLVNGSSSYFMSTPSGSPGQAVADVVWNSGQAKINGTATLSVSIPGGGGTPTWSGTFYLGTPGVTHLSAQVLSTPISANGHLNGMPTGGYVLNAGGLTYGSSTLDTLQPQGFTGNLVGPGSGTAPVTGAIGAGQFSHTDGTKVTLTYGSNLSQVP